MTKKSNLKIYAGLLPLASVAAAAAGQALMYFFKLGAAGLVLFAAAAAMLVIHERRFAENPGIKISKKTEIILFSCIFALAVFMRFFLINEVPAGCFTDEAAIGLHAKRILETGVPKGNLLPIVLSGQTYHPCLMVYPAAAVFYAFGDGITQLRLISAFTGVLGVPAFYFLIRMLMGPLMALAGAFLLAVMRWHVNFSRVSFEGVLPVTLLILVLYFCFRAYRERKTADFALAGFMVAASQYTYVSARLVFAWLAVMLAYLAVKDRGFLRDNLKKIILMAAVMLVFLLPVAGYYMRQPVDLLARTKQVLIFDKKVVVEFWKGEKSTGEAVIETAAKTFGMFNIIGDNNPRHNLPAAPVLDFITGAMALAGFFYALYHILRPEYFFFISFFAVFLVPGLITIEAPQALRTMNVIPAVIFFALVYAGKVVSGIKAKPVFTAAVFAAVLLAPAAENIYVYFGPQAHNRECRKAFSQDEFEAARFAIRLAPGSRMMAYNYFRNSDTFKFIAKDRYKDVEMMSLNSSIPLPAGIKDDIYMLVTSEMMPLYNAIKRIYPSAELIREKDPYTDGYYNFMAVKMHKEDIKSWNSIRHRHGLAGRYYSGDNWQGKPVFTEKKELPVFFWDFQAVAPPSTAEWSGRIYIDKPGVYIFTAQTRDYTAFYIDGATITESWTSKGDGPQPVTLKKGMHKVLIRHRISTDYHRLFMWWQPPGAREKELVPPDVLLLNKNY